jgi:hypothetical protein
MSITDLALRLATNQHSPIILAATASIDDDWQ